MNSLHPNVKVTLCPLYVRLETRERERGRGRETERKGERVRGKEREGEREMLMMMMMMPNYMSNVHSRQHKMGTQHQRSVFSREFTNDVHV